MNYSHSGMKVQKTCCPKPVKIKCTRDNKPFDCVEVTFHEPKIVEKKSFFSVPPGFVDVKDEEFTCSICLENKKCCILVPCNHLATCFTCAKTLKDKGEVLCPLCRVPSTSAIVLGVYV